MRSRLSAIALLATCAGLACGGRAALAQDITTGLIGHWKLTETSGGTATDSSGFARHGTYTNSPALATSTAAPFTGAVSAKFDGVNDYVAIPSESSFDVTGAITVAIWIKVDVFDVAYQAIIGKGDTTWRMLRDSTNNTVEFAIGSGASTYEVFSSAALNDGEWHHVVGVYTGSLLLLYVDGELDDTFSISITQPTNNYAVEIGRNAEQAGREFDGALYDARIYNRALSADDVRYLYTQGKPVLHWKLNETSGTTADDASGLNDGTVVGTATWVAGRRHNAFDFNGSTKIEATTLVGQPTDFTVACWARIDATDTNAAEGVSVGDYIVLRPHEVASSGPTIAFHRGTSNWVTLAGSSNYIGRGWHHFAASFDDSANSLKLYVDGVQVASTTTTYSISWSGQGTKTRAGSHGNANTGMDMDGAVDDVRIYNRTLSASEVADVYGLVGHWKLTQTSGTTATDSSGKGLNGTYTNGPVLAQAGPYPGAGQNAPSFDGTNDYVNGATSTNYTDFVDGFSIAGWVYFDAYIANAAILENGNTTDSCSLSFNSTGQVQVRGRSSGGLQTYTTATTVPRGKWRHVVGTHDGSTFKVYIDGVLDSSSSNVFSLATPAGNLTLGVSLEGTDEYLDGKLHDVRLYNRAVAADEVAELHGLIGRWELDEASGTTANDSSGVTNDGTYTNSPTLAQTGPYPGAGQYAPQFDGTNDHVDVGDVRSDLSEGFSIAAWARPTNVGSWQRFADFGNGSTNDNVFLARSSTTADLILRVYNGSTLTGTLTATNAIENNLWHHYIVTCDNAGNAKLYRDGQQVASGAGVGMPPDVTRTSNYIARSNWGADAYYQGRMQDVRLYNRPLSTAEVAEIYGLIGHWKVNEGSGTTVADSSGTGAAAAFNGGAPDWMSGIYSNALDFNGTTDDTITSAIYAPPSTGTVAYWFRSNGTPTARQRHFGLGSDWEAWQDPDNILRFDLGGDGNVGGFETVSTPATAGSWYHFAAMFDSADDSFAIYINGALDNSGTSTVNLTERAAAQLSLGTRTGTTDRMSGGMDDFRVYNRKLSPWEVYQVYGLMAWYKMDETSGTAAVDSTGRGQDGAYSGSPTLNVAANGNVTQGTAVGFTGASYMQATGLYDKSSSVSAAAWVRLDGVDSAGAEVVSLGDCFTLRLHSGSSGASARYYNGSSYVTVTASQTTLNAGWHHFVAVLDGGSTLKLYIDGVEAASTAASGAISYTGQGSNTRLASHGNGGTTLDLTGRIDDVRVFNRAMKPTEVSALYQGTKPLGVRILSWIETR